MPARPAVRISHHEREIRTATIIVDQVRMLEEKRMFLL